MADEATTINDSLGGSSPQDGGSGDLVPTVGLGASAETIKPEESQDTQKAGEEQKPAEGTETKPEKPEEPTEKENVRFDQHPRFKEIIGANRELRDANSALTERLDKFLQQSKTESKPESFNLDLLKGMSNEDLEEQLQDKPKEFLQKFAEGIRGDMLSQIGDLQKTQQQESEQQYAQRVYDKFGESNPEFWDKWNSGEIEQLMQRNPAHNAMSAFHELSEEERQKNRQKEIDDAVAKAVKETEDRINANIKAKRSVTFVPGAPSGVATTNGDATPDLNDSKKHGGMYTVLANRIKARRQAG